jgi:cytochrome c553
MKMLSAILGAAVLAGAGTAAGAQGDADAGKKIAEQVRPASHGVDGNSQNAAFPKLGGQHADYLERALQDYKSGARRNAIMAGFAATLSDTDRRNVAAHYASQEAGIHTVGR